MVLPYAMVCNGFINKPYAICFINTTTAQDTLLINVITSLEDIHFFVIKLLQTVSVNFGLRI